MGFTVTIEYKGDDYPPQLEKKTLRAINEVLQGFKLKTNLGVDIRTTEGRTIKGKQHWEGIELARLDPVPEERMIKIVGNESRDIASTAIHIYIEIMGNEGGFFFSSGGEIAASIAAEFVNIYPVDTDWEEQPKDWESTLFEFYTEQRKKS